MTSTRAEARAVAAALRGGREEPVACYVRQYTRSDVRIQVGTAGSLELGDSDVVVLADAGLALHERVQRGPLLLGRTRVCGLLGDRPGLSRRERSVIEGHLGPVVGRLGRRRVGCCRDGPCAAPTGGIRAMPAGPGRRRAAHVAESTSTTTRTARRGTPRRARRLDYRRRGW